MIDHVFAEVAAGNGSRTAIREADADTSYRSLDDRATRIAGLVRPAVRPDPPHVGLLLDQGTVAIAAILGVLRAGLAYVPLDPADPPVRLHGICADARIRALVTSERHAALAARIVPDGVPVIRADGTDDRPSDDGATRPDGHLRTTDDPAVLVYTSGSTGQPKGVIQTHRTLLHYAASYADRLGIGSDDRVSLLYTLSFSATSLDIYGALLRGATLCTYDIRRRGLDGVAAFIDEERISVLHSVPTVFRFVAGESPAPAVFGSVRVIDLGGEPVVRSDVRLARQRFAPDCLFVNHYAATEVSVIAQHVAEPADGSGDGLLPAGLAAAGMEILLLREDGSPADPGEAGEIVVRSRFLSPGYWGRPELTERSFRDASADGSLRSYRTGDTGRRDEHGRLVVLGRRDARVKIRGHSVDPGEVEAALRGLPGVRDAVVIVERGVAEAPGDPRLVGYVLVDRGRADATSLRTELRDRLPLYMLPRELRFLATFPVTSTGKVDRAALRSVPELAPAAPAPADPPEGDLETRVAEIFADLLGVAVTSRHDDFFMLGGTSLTLTQLQTVMAREMGSDADPGEIVRRASVAEVAASVDRRLRGAGRPVSSLLVPLREGGDGPGVFLVHGWHGQAFVSPVFLDAIDARHPVHAVQARGLTDDAEPNTTVEAMAAAYLAAIREFRPHGAPVLIGICAGSIIAQEMARRLHADGQPVAALVMIDPPFPPHAKPRISRLRDVTTYRLGLSRHAWARRLVGRSITRQLASRDTRIGPTAVRTVPVERDAAVRVALSVGIALRRYRPQAYDGPVHVLASKARLRGNEWRSGIWRRLLTGPIELMEVGERHQHVLDPSNDVFRTALRRAMATLSS